MKRPEQDFIVVGLVSTVSSGDFLRELERRLSIDDRNRAARFRVESDRIRFILGRALLRRLLRDELGYAPPVLELTLTEHGRPYLAAGPEVAFSISHAGDWIGVALAAGTRIGLDIESVDRRVDLDPLAERIFHPADLARFRALPQANKKHAFFRAWTGKEAVLKAKGLGLFGGVREIRVPLEDVPGLFPDPAASPTTWYLDPLIVSSGYVAAIARDRPLPFAVPRTLAPSELA